MIFLDMDGVLCDFIAPAFAAHGRAFIAEEYPPGLFACEEYLGVSTERFWEPIHAQGEAFWSNLEPYPWAFDLVKELEQIDKVVIATSPSRSPHSYSGKRLWLQRHGLCHIESMFGKAKWLMAKEGRTLVDDGQHNIDAWMKHGGSAVVVPQPWNPVGRCDDVLGLVLCALRLTHKRNLLAQESAS